MLDILNDEYPGAKTELNFSTVFELLVATILSAQSTDLQVNRITETLFKRYHLPEQFAVLEPEELEPLIKGCGLYRNKAKSLVKAAQVVMERFNGQVPDTLEELMELPGVGRKTANVVLSVGFNKPGLGVDTHVQRVAKRLGLVESKNPQKTELQLKKLIPQEKWGKAHHLLIWHGRYCCQALKPRCTTCILANLCPSAEPSAN